MTTSQNSSDPLRVAIVGGGFSGIAAAVCLLSESAASGRRVECTLFEPQEALGAGVAYATESPAHLLNVRASGMSIYNDDASSFVRWLAANFPEYSPHSFVPRHLYQRYLEYSLSEQQAKADKFARLIVIRESVISMAKARVGGYELVTSDGRKTAAEFVILALGNLPFTPSFGASGDSVLENPWSKSAIKRAARANSVGIVGTGLTAIDVVLALESEGCTAHYTLISRHGQLPSPHVLDPQDPAPAANLHAAAIGETNKVSQTLRFFRNALDEGVPWRDLIDALRPFTQRLWASWSTSDKARFLRHLRCLWDTHRHRVPIETLKKIDQLRKSSRLLVIPGTVSTIQKQDEGVLVSFRKRGQYSEATLSAEVAFNSIGLISDIRKNDSPFIGNLIADGLATFDEMFMGLKASSRGNVLTPNGVELSSIYVLGPLRRGELWETTAVREIRTQAAEIAKSIIQQAREVHLPSGAASVSNPLTPYS